jgi:thioredoxin reductase
MAMPYRFYPHDSHAGRQLLREAGRDGSRLPVVIFRTGQVLVDPSHAELTEFLETSLPGVFAAGDVRHRSVKRVASAVGEGAIAVQLAHEYLAEQPG